MKPAVQPIPDGYHSVTTYLVVDGAQKAIEFYKAAFGATVKMCMPGPNGKVGHAEIQIGDSPVMLADEHPDMGIRGPKAFGGTPVMHLLYVEDADAVFARAVESGATVMKPLQDQFYGDRSGTVQDPWGHVWTIATHKEDLTPEEIQKRAPKSC